MAMFALMTEEKATIADHEDESNCGEESIVHNDGDHRDPITESPHNNEHIIKCIGQLESQYKYIEHSYEQKGSQWGTATVFNVSNNKCFLLSVAHNIRKKVKKCKEEIIMIGATTIKFRRREITLEARVMNEEEKQENVFRFGDNRKCYVCKCEYFDDSYDSYPLTTAGYDYCILSFINDDDYNYKKYCKNITIKHEIDALKNKTIPSFLIYGYPMLEPQKRYKMYGMAATSNNYSLPTSKYTTQYYFKHKEIDVTKGQSGAVIWYKNNDIYVIFAIHTGGNDNKKFNVGTIINDNILKQIKYVIAETFDLYSIGENKFGEQGNGTSENVKQITKIKTFTKKIKNIICGLKCGFILLNNNTYECCGFNEYGNLGIEHFNNINQLSSIDNIIIKIKNIFTTPNNSLHSFCISESNKLYATGWNQWNQLGIQTNEAKNNKWIEIEMKTSEIIKKVSTSHYYTTFLSKSGKIFSVGYSRNGGLGLGKDINKAESINEINTTTTFMDIHCGWGHALGIDNNKCVWSWGYGADGKLGHGDKYNKYTPTIIQYFITNNIKIRTIFCGNSHSVVLSFLNEIYCFGRNKEYQCGNDHTNNVYIPECNNTLKPHTVVDIKSGGYHNVIKTDRNQYYLWGHNEYNQRLYISNSNSLEIPKYVTKPLLFNSNYFPNDKEVIDIYLGAYSTRIIVVNKNE